MADVVVRTPMQYLDRALTTLRDMGMTPAKTDDAPINGLLQQISDLDQDRIAVIARTLNQASNFNEIVREQISGDADRRALRQITRGFQLHPRRRQGAWSTKSPTASSACWERATNVWMKMSRGDVADRFDKIRAIYLGVTKETKNQIEREHAILEAYRDFRGALKQAEVMALEVLKKAECEARRSKKKLNKAADRRLDLRRHRARRTRQPRAHPRRSAAPDAGRGQTLSDRQGPLRQSDDRLQHVRSDHGAADADDERQGAHLRASGHLLLDQRHGADGAQGLVHRHVRPARIDRDRERDEGRRLEIDRGRSPKSATRCRRRRSAPATARRSAPTR